MTTPKVATVAGGQVGGGEDEQARCRIVIAIFVRGKCSVVCRNNLVAMGCVERDSIRRRFVQGTRCQFHAPTIGGCRACERRRSARES